MTFTIDEIKRELNMVIDEKKERYANNLNNSDFKKNIKIIVKKK